MAWASTEKVVLGCIAFAVWWVLAVFPAVPFLPIGRTAGSLLGAALMVVFRVITPTSAFAAVDLPILGLLFGTMVVSVYLERADMFKYLGHALSWKSRGGKDLLCRVCFLAALSSALFTNDTTCVVLTGFVLKLCRQKNLPPQPFLIALACSANIGSAATPIGNPQNLVIAVQGKLSFGKFLVGIIPAVAVGLVVNTLGLLLFYWKRLSGTQIVEEGGSSPPHAETGSKGNYQNAFPVQVSDAQNLPEISENVVQPPKNSGQDVAMVRMKSNRIPIARRNSDSLVVELANYYKTGGGGELSTVHLSSVRGSATSDLLRLDSRISRSPQLQHSGAEGRISGDLDNHSMESPRLSRSPSARPSLLSLPTTEREILTQKWRRRVFKICVYLVTIGMLAALLAGLNLPWTALTAAVVLMVLDFSDAGPSLAQVSYSLLVFFAGMFITVNGFNSTGAPGQLWTAVEPYARIKTVSGQAILSLVVIILSNVASNVPTVLLLGTRVAASAAATPGVSVDTAWLILSWVSTVAGNLTLVGSAANLIVSEEARRAQLMGYNLSFWNHLRFGVPSTLLVIAAGLPLIHR